MHYCSDYSHGDVIKAKHSLYLCASATLPHVRVSQSGIQFLYYFWLDIIDRQIVACLGTAYLCKNTTTVKVEIFPLCLVYLSDHNLRLPRAIATIDIMAHRKNKDFSLVTFMCMCTESLCRKKDIEIISSCFFTTKATTTLNFKVLHACMLECVFHQVTLVLTTVVQLARQLAFRE